MRGDSWIFPRGNRARYYDVYLDRFIQADTIVPEPGSSQAWNRYMYTLGNPLRYTDPSGNYSEEEIMQSFGVTTWEEVLAIFEQGGMLEGLWGWLELLRKAENDYFVSINHLPKSITQGAIGRQVEIWNGGYFGRDDKTGGIYITFGLSNLGVWQQDYVAAFTDASYYFLSYTHDQTYNDWNNTFFFTEPDHKWDRHLKWDASRFSLKDVGHDLFGIGVDLIPGSESIDYLKITAEYAAWYLDMPGVVGAFTQVPNYEIGSPEWWDAIGKFAGTLAKASVKFGDAANLPKDLGLYMSP